jgi:hypothetical protein
MTLNMSIEAELATYWGEPRLYRWDHSAVNRTNLSSHTKDFLTKFGMPSPSGMSRIIGLYRFDWDPDLRLDLPSIGRRQLTNNRGFLIDERQDNCVVRPELPPLPGASQTYPELLYNMSPKLFAMSITEYHKYLSGHAPYIDIYAGTESFEQECQKSLSNVDILQERLFSIDKHAFNSEFNGWKAHISNTRTDCELNP